MFALALSQIRGIGLVGWDGIVDRVRLGFAEGPSACVCAGTILCRLVPFFGGLDRPIVAGL